MLGSCDNVDPYLNIIGSFYVSSIHFSNSYYTGPLDIALKYSKSYAHPSNRSRTSDLRISAINQLQSSALPTELSRAHTKRNGNSDPIQQE